MLKKCLIKGISVVFCAVLLVGCGKSGLKTEQTTGNLTDKTTLEAGEEESLQTDELQTDENRVAVEKSIEEITREKQLGNKTAPAVLTLEEAEMDIEKQKISYGQLAIDFPTEVTAKVVESEKEGTTIELKGAEEWTEYRTAALAPIIRFVHYKAEYENSANLISCLLDLFPKAELNIKYLHEGDREYSYQIISEYYKYFVLVRGEELYLVEEIYAEDDYSFGYLMEENTVEWKDAGKKVQYSQKQAIEYMKVKTEEECSFLCMYDYRNSENRNIYFYLDGWFENPYQTLRRSGYITIDDFVDLNFDGYTDVMSSEKFYLWNPQIKEYEEVGGNLEELNTWDMKLFPESEIIWNCDSQYLDDSWEYVEQTENLWQWEGNSLVKLRECKLVESEQGVRIYCYEKTPDRLLFDEFIRDEDWEESSKKVQKLYEQFYEGMIPKEAYALNHRRESEKNYIPQALVDELTEAMLTGTELEYLKPMVHDRELSEEEKIALAKENMDLRVEIDAAYSLSTCLMVETDADNDGIKDIMAEVYYGGSGGFTDFVFFKGASDGTFAGTDRFSSVQQEFAVIQYKDRNYLCRTDFNYSKKIYNGFTLSYYENGRLVEEVGLRLSPDDYKVKLEDGMNENYRTLAETTVEKCLSYKEIVDEYDKVVGDAEVTSDEEKHSCTCDLDNDGKKESYSKVIWTPSNLGTTEGLNFMEEDEDDGIAQVKEALKSGSGEAIMMWVDACGEENVVNVMYRTGLDDFEIIGYLISEIGYETVYRITADAIYGVEQRRVAPYQEEYKIVYWGV